MRTAKYHLNRLLLGLEYLFSIYEPKAIPTQLYLEPTTLCNLACPACPTGAGQQVIREKADLETYKEVVRAYAQFLDKWYLYNWGEPLLNSSLQDILLLLSKEPFKIMMSSNFSARISDDLVSQIASTSNLNLRIDIDGITQEKHQLYRVKSNLELIKRNCLHLSDALKDIPPEARPHVWIGTLSFEHNKEDIDSIRDFANILGFAHKSYEDPLNKGDNPLSKEKKFSYSPGYGCTWLHNSLCLTPSAEAIAPCCGTWHPAYHERVNNGPGSSFEAWSTSGIMNARRALSFKRRSLDHEEFTSMQLNNARLEDAMGLNQGKLVGDICENCVMGGAYQKDLGLIVNGAAQSASVVLDKNLNKKFLSFLQSFTSSALCQNEFDNLRNLLSAKAKALSMDPRARTIEQYSGVVDFISGLI